MDSVFFLQGLRIVYTIRVVLLLKRNIFIYRIDACSVRSCPSDLNANSCSYLSYASELHLSTFFSQKFLLLAGVCVFPGAVSFPLCVE